MKRWYAIGPVATVDDPIEGRYQCAPDGCIGWIDTRPIGDVAAGFFTFAERPEHLASTHDIIGDGTRLDEYRPTLSERMAWERAYGYGVSTTSTLLEMLVSLLTDKADPDGLERCRPLTVDHRGNYEIHLGGHSRIYRAKFQGERDRLWPNLQRLWQGELRKTHAAEAKRGVDADVQAGKMLAELARLHRCPAALLTPKELKGLRPRKPTTVYRDDFERADGELSAAGNATWGGVDQGWGWVKVSNLPEVFSVVSGKASFPDVGGIWCLYAHDAPLSSPNTSTKTTNDTGHANLGARQADATPGIGALCYISRVYPTGNTGAIFLVTDTTYTRLSSLVAISTTPPFNNMLTCDGSTITATHVASDGTDTSVVVTDTSLPSGRYTGLVGRYNATHGDFEARDLLAASVPPELIGMRAV